MLPLSILLKKIATTLQEEVPATSHDAFMLLEDLLEQFNYQFQQKKISHVVEYNYRKEKIKVQIKYWNHFFTLRFMLTQAIQKETEDIKEEFEQLLKFEKGIQIDIRPSFFDFNFHEQIKNFNQLRRALELIFLKVEQILTNPKRLTYHACGQEFTPGWNAFKGVVYHGISKKFEKKITHLTLTPLRAHYEYAFPSISTTCDPQIALDFAQRGNYLIIQYQIDTNRLYVLEEGATWKDSEEILSLSPEAILIPLGGLVEHEIAVLDPKILKPVAVLINLAGTNQYKKIMIPKEKAAIEKLETQLLQYGNEQTKLRDQKIYETKEIQRILWDKFPGVSLGFYYTNYLPEQGYQVSVHEELQEPQKLAEELNQKFTPLEFSVSYTGLKINFDSLSLFIENFLEILKYVELFRKRD